MNYTPVPSTFYQPALHSTSFQSPAPNHQQLVPFFKKHRCSYCYYSSDRAFDLKKHQTRKHSDLISMDGDINSHNENGSQSKSFQSPASNHQQLVPFFKKHRCSYCYYSSDRAFDLKKHQTRKHSDLISMDGERHVKSKHKEIKNYNMEKMVLLCGNCELITACIDEMIRHKKDEHNIIYSQNSLENSLINADQGEGGMGEVNDGGVGVDEGDVIKDRAWNNPSFKERGYESYF